jgi:hypothetical protein
LRLQKNSRIASGAIVRSDRQRQHSFSRSGRSNPKRGLPFLQIASARFGRSRAISLFNLYGGNALKTGRWSTRFSICSSGCSWPGAAVAYTRPKRTLKKAGFFD